MEDKPSARPIDGIVINEIHQLAINYLAPLTGHVASEQMKEFNMLHCFAFMVYLHLERKGIIKAVYDENRVSHCSCGETPCTCPF